MNNSIKQCTEVTTHDLVVVHVSLLRNPNSSILTFS